MTRRVLAPLFALEALQEGPEIVRDLAHKLAPSLGILEREPIRAQLKALSQSDRAELRKQGVRFGAYYLFLPALIKPAARTLAVQLWSLRASGDAGELLRALSPVASSGRTSLSLDSGISHDGYRVAGYRACGERLVRVDIIERLAGMIRATVAGEPAGAGYPSRSLSKGFVVNGQMTSLTGCSGEQFASILRSMGLRSAEVRRSEFFGAQSSGEAARASGSSATADDRQTAGNEEASSPTASEEGAPADAVPAAPSAEAASDANLQGADAPREDEDGWLQGSGVVAEGEDLPEAADAAAESADAVAGGDDPVSGDAPDISNPALEMNAGEASVSSQTSDGGAESAKDDDLIVVWRPDRSRVARNRRPSENKPSGRGTRSRVDDDRSPVPGRTRARKAAPHPPPDANRPDPAPADEKRRQRASDYDMPRSKTTTAPQHRAKVDPNSPFAKLLELRSRLEEQANKRS